MSVALPRVVIAAPASGVGKTTVSSALARALVRRGLRVATFKCGPDYLDPSYLSRASRGTCHNLDGVLMGEASVRATFAAQARDADISVIEAMMGLFDGASATTLQGSSAEIARWLDAPVILVCDASAMARSIAALVHGFARFEPGVRVAGVVANRIGGPGHRAILEQACSDVPLVGALSHEPGQGLAERHLGLHVAGPEHDVLLDAWADRLEQQCDVERLLEIAHSAPTLAVAEVEAPARVPKRCTIGVARDEAFHFYYADNLRLLEQRGAELRFFSPLHDATLPVCDGLYFGGGYPELHAAALAANASMLAAVRAHVDRGAPAYAECGGLMYLADAIVTRDGVRHAMLGRVQGDAVVCERLQAIGYVEVTTRVQTPLGPPGTRLRGHQFRHSRLQGAEASGRYELRTLDGRPVEDCSYASATLLASYVHVHFASNPDVPNAFITACEEARR